MELALRADKLVGRSWYDLFRDSRARQTQHESLFRGERVAMELPRVALAGTCGKIRYFSIRLSIKLTP